MDFIMEELTNFDIIDYKLYFKINLICCIDYHDIIKYKLVDGSYVLNMGNQHWTCLFIKNKKGVYFDSYGAIFPLEVKQFCPNIIYNDNTIQSLNSVLCGFFCLYFLYYMTNQYKYNLTYTLNNFISKFDDNVENNNKILQTLIKKYII